MFERQVINAMEEKDGIECTSFIFFVDPGVCTDLVDAIKKASDDFVNTEYGNQVYQMNGQRFDWIDFYQNVPNEICSKYGFQKLEEKKANYVVDMDVKLLSENPAFSLDKWHALQAELFRRDSHILKSFINQAENVNYLYTNEQLKNEGFVYKMMNDIRPLLTTEYLQSWYDELLEK